MIESPVDGKGLRFNLFEERFYKLTHMKALPMIKNVFELFFAYVFFNYPISQNLSDASINKNITYANLMNLNPLQKQEICRSITNAIWKQKKVI